MEEERRPVFIVMSARSLPYAGPCMTSLLANAREALALTVITDGPEDKVAIQRALDAIGPGDRHAWRVVDNAEADEVAAVRFAEYPHIQAFRRGHPCWRKVTDPALFAEEGGEMIILDPDVYFPNPFRFEATPDDGLLLMWQPKNCLLPYDVVRRAFREGVRLADHTDIGVCHANNPMDWGWLDELIGRLGGAELPRWSPHVESIVWAALAMHMGGGYLDPKPWLCWHNTLAKRLKVRVLKRSGVAILGGESIRGLKAFHAGGQAKGWLGDAARAGIFAVGEPQERAYAPIPFTEYRLADLERKLLVRKVAGWSGLLKLVGTNG